MGDHGRAAKDGANQQSQRMLACSLALHYRSTAQEESNEKTRWIQSPPVQCFHVSCQSVSQSLHAAPCRCSSKKKQCNSVPSTPSNPTMHI